MSTYKSLAEALGLVLDPLASPEKPSKLSARALAKSIIRSPEYLESIRRRILADTLPPAVEVLLHHTADGKPVERVEMKDTSDQLANLSAAELDDRLEKLSALARKLRGDEEEPSTVQ